MRYALFILFSLWTRLNHYFGYKIASYPPKYHALSTALRSPALHGHYVGLFIKNGTFAILGTSDEPESRFFPPCLELFAMANLFPRLRLPRRVLLLGPAPKQAPLRGEFDETPLPHLLRGIHIALAGRSRNLGGRDADVELSSQYLFDSLRETRVLRCGHTMHSECLSEMLRHDQ